MWRNSNIKPCPFAGSNDHQKPIGNALTTVFFNRDSLKKLEGSGLAFDVGDVNTRHLCDQVNFCLKNHGISITHNALEPEVVNRMHVLPMRMYITYLLTDRIELRKALWQIIFFWETFSITRLVNVHMATLKSTNNHQNPPTYTCF